MKQASSNSVEHRCRVCNVVLTDDNWFPSYRKKRDYLCKTCRADRGKKYRAANGEKIKAASKKHREDHKEQIKIEKKEYYEKNKDGINKRSMERYYANHDDNCVKAREHYMENRDDILEKNREHRANNIDEYQERERAYREKNKERIEENMKQYRIDNKDKIKKKQEEYRRQHGMNPRKMLSKDLLEEISYKYETLKMTLSAIGEEYDVSGETVRKLLNDNGVVINPRGNRPTGIDATSRQTKTLFAHSTEGCRISIRCAYNTSTDHIYMAYRIDKSHGWKGGAATNPSCGLYLGVVIAEQLLAEVFDNVEQMPPRNPGFDFICGGGYKIDVKSSCIRSNGRWSFHINGNTTADYFLCVAFDNRNDLNPVHLWLIPGRDINHLIGASICELTIHKWDKYELTDKLDQVISRCDAMRS